MAQTLGLTKKQRQAYFRTLTVDHERRVRVDVLDLNGRHQADLNAPLLDGVVTCDTTGSPAVSLDATFYDPGSRIGFEPDVGDYPTYRRRMLRVFVDVRVRQPELNRWVPCVVFTGPIVSVSREGAALKVVCHDKSTLAMGVAWKSRTFKKGRKRTDVVKAILSDAGENRMAVAKGDGRLGKKLVVGKMDKRWQKAKAAMPVGRVLFYNSRGVAICRRPPSRPQYVVPRALVLSAPVENREANQPANRFQLIGGKPTKKAKKKVRGKPQDLPNWHPDNPRPGSGIGRNGKRNIHPKVVTNDKIKSQKVANHQSRKMRNDAAGAAVEVSFDIVPVPHLEPYDVVLVKTTDGSYRVKLTQFSMSLTNGVMSIGSKRRAAAKPRGGKDHGRPKR